MNQLIQILSLVPHTQIIGSTDICIGDIQFDSRKVGKPEQGVSMYIAQKGTQSDGHRFIDSSIEKGAQVIVCETTI